VGTLVDVDVTVQVVRKRITAVIGMAIYIPQTAASSVHGLAQEEEL